MRLVLITAVLGLLVQPAFAKKIDCAGLKDMAEFNYQGFKNSLKERNKLADSKLRADWTKDDYETYKLWQKLADEQLREVEIRANIYSAFCKD
jgi:hypothetical protein